MVRGEPSLNTLKGVACDPVERCGDIDWFSWHLVPSPSYCWPLTYSCVSPYSTAQYSESASGSDSQRVD